MLGQSLRRPGCDEQGCRGSEVAQTSHRPAGTEGPATENGDTSAGPPKSWHPRSRAVPLGRPVLKPFKKVESILLLNLPVGGAESSDQ